MSFTRRNHKSSIWVLFMEDFVYILDFIPSGKPDDKKGEPVAQAVGEKNFTLLELVPKRDKLFKPKDRVYVGEKLDERESVDHIRGRIEYKELTRTSQLELEELLDVLVAAQEQRFVDFFNRAGSVTTKLHQIELIPGIGKKHMWEILDQRDKKKFESFADLCQRVSLMPEPTKSIAKKVLSELKGEDKYLFFTLPIRRSIR